MYLLHKLMFAQCAVLCCAVLCRAVLLSLQGQPYGKPLTWCNSAGVVISFPDFQWNSQSRAPAHGVLLAPVNLMDEVPQSVSNQHRNKAAHAVTIHNSRL